MKTRQVLGPEAIIQEAVVKKLRSLEWFVMVTHGNAFQQGFPDLYATHRSFGLRWIEIKNPKAYSFTPAQRVCFPQLSANGTCIWILTGDSDEEYNKLFRPHNWEYYYLLHGLGQR